MNRQLDYTAYTNSIGYSHRDINKLGRASFTICSHLDLNSLGSINPDEVLFWLAEYRAKLSYIYLRAFVSFMFSTLSLFKSFS